MGFFSKLVKGGKELLFGKEGEIKSSQVPKWTTEQQALFRQLYGTVGPEVGQGLAPTPEDMAYGESLAGYEDKYRALMGEAYDPSMVGRVYAGQDERIGQIYDPSNIQGIYDPTKLAGIYDPTKLNALYSPDATKEYYRNVVMPEFEQTALPKVQSQFAGPGYWGSARARAVGEAYAGIGRQEGAALYDTENQRRAALSSLYGEERKALTDMSGEERASLMSLDSTRRSALLMSDENRRSQVLDLEKQGHSMLANLATQLPVMNETLARWARSFSPEQSPYLQMALTMLGLEPYDTVAGFDPAQTGMVQEFMKGFSSKAGELYGGKLK